MTLEELQAQVEQYGTAKRSRDLAIGAVVLGGASLEVLAIVLAVTLRAPRWIFVPLALLALIVILADGAYVAATSSSFHARHAPRCPVCDARIRGLEFRLPTSREAARWLTHPNIPVESWPRLVEMGTVRCPRCKHAIYTPAV